jgi:hypothetical protein
VAGPSLARSSAPPPDVGPVEPAAESLVLVEELVAPDELPPAPAYTTELVPFALDPDEPPDDPDNPDEAPEEPDAAVLALVDDAAALDEFPAEATSVPEPFSLAAGWPAEDEPPVEPKPGPPTIASSPPPPPDPSLPIVGIVMSVGLRPAAAQRRPESK